MRHEIRVKKMTGIQKMRIHTAAGVEEIDADRLIVQADEYVLLRGEIEVRRVPIADLVHEINPESGEQSSGIETVYSRS